MSSRACPEAIALQPDISLKLSNNSVGMESLRNDFPGFNRLPLPTTVVGYFQNRVIKIKRFIGFADSQITDLGVRKQLQNLVDLLAAQGGVRPVQEGKPWCGEENMKPGQELLLAQ